MTDRILAVIDMTGHDAGVARRAIEADLPARAIELADEVVFLDPAGAIPAGVTERTVLRDFTALRETLAASDIAAVVEIGADQLFLDPEVAKWARSTFSESHCDYATQWEHCLLPVGVGVRLYARTLFDDPAVSSFDDIRAFVRRAGEGIPSAYDDTPHTDLDAARLDSRRLIAAAGPWNLAGFLEAAAQHPHPLEYKAVDTDCPTIDERGMPAAFGFESSACADFPTYVMFDMTNKCNAQCIHCPHSVGFPGAETSTFLSIDSFRHIIDQCVGRKIDFVRITADGEPLLHPDIWELLEYARDKGVGPVGVTTNGSALNDKNARRLLESGAFMVDVSLDAFSEQTFEVVRAGLSYKRTKENVLRLLSLRDELGADLKVMVSFVRQEANAHEHDDFIAYWEPLVDRVLIREMHTNVGKNDNGDYDEVRRYPCPHFFRRIVVNYDGSFKFCPIDWEGGSKYRSVFDLSIADLWHGDFYRDHRMQHLNNSFDDCSLCKGCQDWKGTPWSLGYEKVIGQLGQMDN